MLDPVKLKYFEDGMPNTPGLTAHQNREGDVRKKKKYIYINTHSTVPFSALQVGFIKITNSNAQSKVIHLTFRGAPMLSKLRPHHGEKITPPKYLLSPAPPRRNLGTRYFIKNFSPPNRRHFLTRVFFPGWGGGP